MTKRQRTILLFGFLATLTALLYAPWSTAPYHVDLVDHGYDMPGFTKYRWIWDSRGSLDFGRMAIEIGVIAGVCGLLWIITSRRD